MTEFDVPATPPTEDERNRLLSDNPGDVIYRSGLDYLVEWISPSVTEVLGWMADQIVGQNINAFVHPEDLNAIRDIQATLRSGRSDADAARGLLPMRILASDEEYRWMSVISRPLVDSDGAPMGVVGRFRDVDEAVRSREELEASEAQRRAAFDSLLDPLLVMAPVHDAAGRVVDFVYTDANPAACEYNGMSFEQMIGTRLLEVNPGNGDDGTFDRLVTVLESGVPLILDNHAYHQELKGGERRYDDLRVARAGDVLIYTWRDQTERRVVDRMVAESEELYRLVTDDVTDAVVRYDETATITWVSPSFERLTGFASDMVVGRSGMDILPPQTIPEAEDLFRRRLGGEAVGETHLLLRTADGTTRWIAARSRPFVRRDGTSDGFVAVLRDIQHQVDTQLRHEHEIGRDPLTGLANRQQAAARVDRALDDIGSSRRQIALLSIGVDRLTTVNQALSYSAGDVVLTTISGRIATAVGDPDRVARVAGDEFLVLMTDLASVADAASTAERLCAAARGTIRIEGQSIEPTVSIGVAIGDRSSTSEELLRKASLAVQQAKDAGRDRWEFVDSTLAAEAQRRLRVETQLRDAVQDDWIVAWFQPIVTLTDRRLHGYEALARWIGPDQSVIPPADFLPVAEGIGLIVDIDLAVLAKALDLLAITSVEHVAVNVSPPSLAVADYPARFSALLGASGIDPSRLRLEVTETALLDVSPSIAAAMLAISETGTTWYVDDFGTGFSSISHLRDLPVQGLKLDQSFTAGIRAGDSTCIKLAQGLIGLADGLGLDTVAEGIETEFEAGALLGQGWHLGQGWLFGRPEQNVLGER